MKRKTKLLLFCIITIVLMIISPLIINVLYDKSYLPLKYYILLKSVKVPDEYSQADRNKDSIPDPIDMVNAARKEADNKTPYVSRYYTGGYPPDSEGVCTDVIWRAFKGMNVNLKDLVDKDIASNLPSYTAVSLKPDPNIDFRRVQNLNVFFKRNAKSLTTRIIPGDVNNLKEWQPGDIIVILKPYEHIAILSDKRSRDGIPYVIHNSTPHAAEVSHFNLWGCEIAGHYRWNY